MPVKLLGRIPLVPAYNTRGPVKSTPSGARDQRLIRAVISTSENPFTQQRAAYVNKFPGFVNTSTPGGSNEGTAVIVTPSGTIVTSFGLTTSAIFAGTTSCGSTSGLVYYMNQTIISGITYVLLPNSDGTLWYLASDSYAQTAYTGDTHSNTTIDNIASTAGMYVGQLITGSGIPVGTRIATIASGTAITITAAATATAAGVSLTKTPVAKVIDADFPVMVGDVVEMDGYLFVMTATRRVYQSDLNSVISWGASNFTTADMSTGPGVTVAKIKNQILAMKHDGIDYFYNAGFPSGSVLGKTPQAFIPYGVLTDDVLVVKKSTAAGPNRVCFVGGPVGTRRSIWVIDGFQAKRISNDAVDTTIGVSTFHIHYFGMAGKDFVYFRDATNTTGWLYSFDTGEWTEAGFSQDFYFTDRGSAGIGADANYCVTRSTANGKVYQVNASSPVYEDDSVAYTMTIQISDGGFGTGKRKKVVAVELIADTQASGTTTLAYSDDDGANFTTHGKTFDMTAKEKRLNGLNSYKGHRVWRLTHSANTAWRGQFLDVYGEVAA